ncbi:MAG: glycine zipper family protein [Leptothrix sp. (in: Bacteria)]|nr:glycine zipper family protein [Leptothrix sp. (in: b-proteobacteria)]
MSSLNKPIVTRGLALACVLALSGCVVAPIGPPRHPQPVYRSVPPPPAPVAVAPLYFYPLQHQPEAVQDRDRYECYRWAARETGFDPGMTALRSQGSEVVRGRTYTPAGPNGADVVAGAATGAILGAAVSSPRHAGANAVIGAIFGAALGAAASESRNRAYEDAYARQAEQAERARAPMNNFRRAMSACMQGRGYQVE